MVDGRPVQFCNQHVILARLTPSRIRQRDYGLSDVWGLSVAAERITRVVEFRAPDFFPEDEQARADGDYHSDCHQSTGKAPAAGCALPPKPPRLLQLVQRGFRIDQCAHSQAQAFTMACAAACPEAWREALSATHWTRAARDCAPPQSGSSSTAIMALATLRAS